MKLKLFLILILSLLAIGTLVAFSPIGSAIRNKLLCATETGNCVEGWNGTDVTLYRDPGGTETIRMDGDGAVRIAVPTQVGTATPGLVIQAGHNGNALEVRNSGGTPVSSISGAGVLSGFGSSGLSVAPNIVVAAPTGVGTATPAALINSAGVAQPLEVRSRSTPVIQVFDGGGVKGAAPTAVATTVPVVLIQGQGASNQLEIRNAATTPVASFGPDGSPAFIASSIDATEIANITRNVTLPLMGFIDCTTDAGAALNFSSGADAFPDFINSSTDGLGFTLTFDDTGGTEDTVRICASITVPSDYVSGGAVVARVTKDAETGANTEVLSCAGSINGAALGTAGTATLTGTASAVATCTPTLSSLAAGDSLALTAYITSGGTMDDTVNLHSVQFTYTATQ